MKDSVIQKATCLRCGSEMVRGYLKDSGARVYVECWCSDDYSSLRALVCRRCGHVELEVGDPKAFTHQVGASREVDEDGDTDRPYHR